jgi:hypothetical protein
MNEHDYEPIPGLPAPLPEGERILWQGAPRWTCYARNAMHIRWIGCYFAVALLWMVTDQLARGTGAVAVAEHVGLMTGLAGLALGLLALFAWLVARTTLYTITTRRVVMRIGIALSVTIQIPFKLIETAAVQMSRDGAGDIALTLRKDSRIAYLVLWPHARPWRLATPQPALRGLPDAAAAAETLGGALAALEGQPRRIVQLDVAPAPDAVEPVAPAAAVAA